MAVIMFRIQFFSCKGYHRCTNHHHCHHRHHQQQQQHHRHRHYHHNSLSRLSSPSTSPRIFTTTKDLYHKYIYLITINAWFQRQWKSIGNISTIIVTIICRYETFNTYKINITIFLAYTKHEYLGPFSIYTWANVLANERRRYICDVFSNWLRPCSAIDRKRALHWDRHIWNIFGENYIKRGKPNIKIHFTYEFRVSVPTSFE